MGLSTRGVVGVISRGVQDALSVTAGKAGANIIAGFIPPLFKDAAGAETAMSLTIRRLGGAVGVGLAARTLLKARPDTVRFMVAGALAASVESFVRPLIAGVPVLGGALGAYPVSRMGAYPVRVGGGNGRARGLRSGVGSYPVPGQVTQGMMMVGS